MRAEEGDGRGEEDGGGRGDREQEALLRGVEDGAGRPLHLDRVRRLSAILDDDAEDASVEMLLPRRASSVEMEQDREDESAEDVKRDGYLCVECEAHAAEVFCEQCHDYFCELCFGGQHRKGNRRAHTTQPVVAATDMETETEARRLSVEDMETETVPDPTARESDEEDDDKGASSSEESEDSDSSESSSRGSGSWRPSSRRDLCSLMTRYLFLGAYGQPTRKTLTNGVSTATIPAVPTNSVEAAEARATVIERAKYIPVRLTYEERKLLRVLEAALSGSSYTDKLDSAGYIKPAKRLRTQLQEICGFLTGLVVAFDYADGQKLLEEKDFVRHEGLFQEIFELGRRYKIMNPEKMRGEYGKLMYLLQDAMSPDIRELLDFSCHRKIRTVYDVLEESDALAMLQDPKIEAATMVVAPEGKNRWQIQREIKNKENAIRELSQRYSNRKIDRDGIQQCLYSIADNNYHLYFERDPIDRMIALLQENFHPDLTENDDTTFSLAIVSGQDGARLSHSHRRQFNYVLQSLTLWREIAHDMFRLWCLTDEDLLCDGTKYELTDTGQGLHRVQPAPRVSRAMHVILHATQRRLENWVGSSVIHLGDRNVPNALMFIDKYTQVGYILRPIVKTVDSLDQVVAASKQTQHYVERTFGGVATLKRAILADFFREAFDGSGADNFFEAGSCIDGRLTSAWNWCANLHTKQFYPVFKLAGFVGFDGKFG